MSKISRLKMVGISTVIGVIVIAVLSFALPAVSKKSAEIVLDRESAFYPFTIQNLMILLFFIGLGEVFVRWRDSLAEMAYTTKCYLPEDDRTVLQSHDLGHIRQKVIRDIKKEEGGYLPNLINRCILQFQTSKSVGETNGIMNSIVEIYFHQIDLKYTMLRYIAWAIPTFGFIGTVVGIASSLSGIKQEPDMDIITSSLGLAFNTTLIALLLSAVLVFLIHIVQEKEEKSLNKSMEYCLINLINRLYSSD